MLNKSCMRREKPKDMPQGLKPNIDLIGFIGPTEVVPLLQSLCSGHAREFFRKL
jgi:hypothetical protein